MPSLRSWASASVPGGEEGAFWGEEGGPPPKGRPGPFQAMEGVSAYEGLSWPEVSPGGPDQHPTTAPTVPVSRGAQAAGRPQLLPGEGGQTHGLTGAGQGGCGVVPLLGLGHRLPGSGVHSKMLFHRPLVDRTVLLGEGAGTVLHRHGGRRGEGGAAVFPGRRRLGGEGDAGVLPGDRGRRGRGEGDASVLHRGRWGDTMGQ